MLDISNIFLEIRKWGNQRNIIQGSTPKSQLIKLDEEVRELKDAIINKDLDEISDAIGDITVVLTMIAAQYDKLAEDCIVKAYYEIKDRKGKMVNGLFIKEKEEYNEK